MLPLVKKMTTRFWILWLKVSFSVKWSHAFYPQSVLRFSSSLLVFSRINIGAKIMIFSWIAVSVSEVMIFRTKGMQWGTFAHRVHTEKFE